MPLGRNLSRILIGSVSIFAHFPSWRDVMDAKCPAESALGPRRHVVRGISCLGRGALTVFVLAAASLTRGQEIQLGDIVAGGDGSGTAAPDVTGISADTGLLQTG